jgi:tryptophan synthase alpha chain
VDAGVSGVIVPDLPVDEAGDWVTACASASVSPVFLAAPDTPDARLRMIAKASGGFVYCVATYGVTGARDRLAESAPELIGRLRSATDLPLLLGVGITVPAQAAQACAFADGVVVGSALVQHLLGGDRSRTQGLAQTFAATIHGE